MQLARAFRRPPHPAAASARDRPAMPLHVRERGPEVVEGRLRGHESELHEPPGRIVHVDEQRAPRAAPLEPLVIAAVDLDELAEAVPPIPRLVDLAGTLAPGGPQAGRDEPLAESLPANPKIVEVQQLLLSEGGSEVGVVLADDRDGALPDPVRQPVVARPASLQRNQPRGPTLRVPHAEPVHLAGGEPDQLSGLRLRQTALQDSSNHVHTVGEQMEAALQARGVAPLGVGAAAWIVLLSFALGVILVWLQAAVEPRLGPALLAGEGEP